MNGNLRLLRLAFALGLCLVCLEAQASTIDTILGWNSIDQTNTFGELASESYGQTITVPAQNVLQSFTFVLLQNSAEEINFHAYVMEFAGGAVTGSVLFQSGPLSTINDGFYHDYTIPTGGLVLNSGVQYVLFFSVLESLDGEPDGSSFASRNSADVYPGGEFVFSNADTFGGLEAAWTGDFNGENFDLAFQAVFVPEPGGLVLGAVGIGILCGTLRRGQRTARKWDQPE